MPCGAVVTRRASFSSGEVTGLVTAKFRCGGGLRGGQRDGGLEKVEGAALVGGGFGEHRDFGVGACVADLVAGEGGQVVEQAAEAAQRIAGGVALCGGLGVGVG